MVVVIEIAVVVIEVIQEGEGIDKLKGDTERIQQVAKSIFQPLQIWRRGRCRALPLRWTITLR